MNDCKVKLIADVTEALADKLDQKDVNTVSDEMALALRDYEVTKAVTDIVQYDGFNENIQKRYRACLIIAGRSPKTIEQYDRMIRKLSEAVQKNYLDMTASDLRYFLALEKNRGVSNRTLENERVMISSFFGWLIDEELIAKNPCRTIKPIKYADKIRLPFSNIEIDAIRTACKTPKERAIVELLLSSGIRVSELCALRISDIDFDRLTINVLEGKGAKQRTVFFNEVARKYVANYLSNRDVNGEYLFYNKKKEPLHAGGVRHILKTIEERSGTENVHPHRFRRTLASTLVSRGMGIQEISKLLGHADLNTTMTYVYTSTAQVQASYTKYATL